MALFLSGFFQVIEEGPEASEEYYRKWVDTVKAVVPEERLLVFDVKQVWQIQTQFRFSGARFGTGIANMSKTDKNLNPDLLTK